MSKCQEHGQCALSPTATTQSQHVEDVEVLLGCKSPGADMNADSRRERDTQSPETPESNDGSVRAVLLE